MRSLPFLIVRRTTARWFQSPLHRGFQTSSVLDVEGTRINMPSLSPTMSEGTIVKWLKKEGESVAPGDALCEIQTDKAIMAMDADEEGILAKIVVNEDVKDVKVGTLIALMVEEGEDWKNVDVPADSGAPTTPETASASSLSADAGLSGVHANMMGPAVRNLLDKYGLQLQDVGTASGRLGNVIKEDVLNYIEKNKLQPVSVTSAPPSKTVPSPPSVSVPPPAPKKSASAFEDIPLTSMRKTIAKRLTEAKQSIPHAYSTITCPIDAVLELRQKMKRDGANVSVNDFVVKAIAEAIKRVPEVNCIWEGESLVYPRQADISVAVATDAGLITPIVTNVGRKSLEHIAEEVRELAGRARAGKLQPQEFLGGTFTISNLGMFGIHEFSAIINPPQCAILAVGGGRKEFVGETMSEGTTTMMSVKLSYDARAISEEEAAMFLSAFRDSLRFPALLLNTSTERIAGLVQ